MAIAVIAVASNGLPVSQATAPFGYPVTVSTNGFGLAVVPVASGGRPVFDTAGTLFGPPVIPANLTPPIITGTAQAGFPLSIASNGTWSGTAATFTYQWKRGATNVGVGASVYLLVGADVGNNMTCVVTATNAAGSANATSNALGPVLSGLPSNTVLPIISGTTTVGNTITTSNGTWTGTPTISYTYQWKSGGVNVSGETASSYVIRPTDVGEMLSVVVTATNSQGSVSVSTGLVGPVAATGTGPTPPIIAMDGAWTSADTTPDFTLVVDNTVVAGDSIRLQIQPALGGWTSLTDDVLHVITAGEDSANLITLATGALGNGNYEARAFVIDTVTGASLPSNVVSFAITGGSASAATYYFLGF